MKKLLVFSLLLIFAATSYAQKKLTPATKSAVTEIDLPAGSKQDGRLMSQSMAGFLMDTESDKRKTTLRTAEVLVLTPASVSKFNKDSLLQQLSSKNWKIVATEGDNYLWLQKDKRFVIAFFSMDAKESSLYFAEANSIPDFNAQPENTTSNQPSAQTIVEPAAKAVVLPALQPVNQPTTQPVIANGKFAFSTTNFDDGWVSTVQEDWVEVKKGSMQVLLHYPKEGTIFPADPGPMTNAAWDILVAPRYSNLKNYKTTYITTFERPHLGMGYATENVTGNNVFIVFFHRGQTGWLEFIAPDKNTFIQHYKFDPETIQWDSNEDLMIPLVNMAGYNKFAVAASDLKGRWTSDFTGIQQMYYAYSGAYAGMNINQSNEEFVFNADNTYNWKLLVVAGMAGSAKANQVKSSGTFTLLNNWQVKFSMIETRARTYHAFWSCIKGVRILNLLDADFPGSGIYTKYGLAK